MQPSVSALTIAAILAATPARAFDASGADLLGVRLNMSEADVAAQMAHQGFSLTKTTNVCSDKTSCVVTLKALTKDGELRIILSNETNARRIEYTIHPTSVDEPNKLKTSMINRFGNPSQQKPIAWCRAVPSTGLCPADQASLTYWPETLTIVLKSGETDRH